MKVLITGIAGFIGSHLMDRLVTKGHTVDGIDNLSTGNLKNMSDHRLYVGSVAQMNDLNFIFDRYCPDVVIHAAASYSDPTDWYNDIRTNVLGTANVVRKCLDCKVKRLIYFQTSLCYGTPQEQPITLTHPLNPKNSYAITKTAAERYIAMSGLDFISFRLANCCGPRNLSGPIPTFFKQLSEGKKCVITDTKRDFVYVDDLVDIVELAIEGKGSRGFYHISSGKEVSIREVFDTVRLAMAKLHNYTYEMKEMGKDDVSTILLDPSKTETDFGIIPKTPIYHIINEAVKWYIANGVRETFTHLKMEE